ncbi:MAG: hypothetical protein EPN40_03820 [Rhodanobacteraceae bacterium]|nr:MAG: hypothetical protein EPN40_03820 [Rhodanobacteraceae bacterium]
MPIAVGIAGSISACGIGHASPAAQPDKGEVVARDSVRGYAVPIYEIGEIEADNTPQGMDGFAIRVAYVLHAWTREHGVEAIGNLCHTRDGQHWGTLLLTIYAHTASPRTDACPTGMQSSGVDIHSHPQRWRYPVNAVDRLFLHDGLLDAGHVSTQPDVYSPDDLQAPGYLAGQMKLHFQDGRGHQRIVWNMATPEPVVAKIGARARSPSRSPSHPIIQRFSGRS